MKWVKANLSQQKFCLILHEFHLQKLYDRETLHFPKIKHIFQLSHIVNKNPIKQKPLLTVTCVQQLFYYTPKYHLNKLQRLYQVIWRRQCSLLFKMYLVRYIIQKALLWINIYISSSNPYTNQSLMGGCNHIYNTWEPKRKCSVHSSNTNHIHSKPFWAGVGSPGPIAKKSVVSGGK